MSRAALLARARAAAEAGMVDACTIRRATGERVSDGYGDVTDEYVDPDPYAGKCRVQLSRYSSSSETDVGEDQVVLLAVEVQLPMSVVGLEVGDEVHMTASQTDPDLVGRVFVIRSLMHKTDASSRRPQCTERTA
ncbi:hypothetical protein GCM10010435_44420 [Winogradskya consettensis]|uniref:Head-to-tail stopper n=1 Tax=Winogradskya consettensis TaxID=113560 RepID=A0A919T0R2_9ACTN|nr:DUF6093 family protein [Actinoplanes consettensis]GIM82696.1 hypothetical protein Aco04nite_82810 [Actinoplanes consettensis]